VSSQSGQTSFASAWNNVPAPRCVSYYFSMLEHFKQQLPVPQFRSMTPCALSEQCANGMYNARLARSRIKTRQSAMQNALSFAPVLGVLYGVPMSRRRFNSDRPAKVPIFVLSQTIGQTVGRVLTSEKTADDDCLALLPISSSISV
jgi:hypothetical protein